MIYKVLYDALKQHIFGYTYDFLVNKELDYVRKYLNDNNLILRIISVNGVTINYDESIMKNRVNIKLILPESHNYTKYELRKYFSYKPDYNSDNNLKTFYENNEIIDFLEKAVVIECKTDFEL
jgi:hypothetical protein